MKRHSQQGVALIITLILLAVVTVMTVAFLAISRRERGAVTTTTDTASARLAADAALASAEAQIMANVLATTNPYNFGLVVSTNYITAGGYQAGTSSLTNINYFDAGGNLIAGNDFLANVSNLFYSPRVPVFIQTNTDTTRPLDFRFYLDLNRNGRFDTNGVVANIMDSGAQNGTISEVGDPEWIGVLDHPDQPHGPNNHFIARYAFVAVPVGNALDLNAIYNEAVSQQVNTNGTTVQDGFLRNQGVGSWEINLAAFLADLNTNEWDPVGGPNPGFFYNEALPNPPGPSLNKGYAFEDALALLSYRYGYYYKNLFSVGNLFGAVGATAFKNDTIDGYSDGPLQTTFNTNEDFFAGNDNPTLAWSGSDNTNQFFDLQELFDRGETQTGVNPPGFTDRLLDAGTGVSTYNRYTFYRLLSQMGVDSAPEQGKMNLNYDNLDAGLNGFLNVNGTASATNFVPWTPLGFFTNAADRMLREYSEDWLARDPSNYVATYDVTNAFGLTNIPVWIGASNRFVYSSAIQRVLQLAANIYDATTNNAAVMGNNYPSVFRPTLNVLLDNNGYTNVYINGYQQVVSVTGVNDFQLDLPTNATSLLLGSSVDNYADGVNVYGVPWIIGVKKGFPNFNEFSMENMVGITRRLQVTRLSTNNAPIPDFTQFRTNQMYAFIITNWMGVECWNSYASNYPDPVQIVVRDNLSMTLTNDNGMTPVNYNFVTSNLVNPFPWPGSMPWNGGVGIPNTNSFKIPLYAAVAMPLNAAFLGSTDWWAYSFNYQRFFPMPTDPVFETNGPAGFPFPHFGLLTTNRLQVFMLDGTNVIDYAQFAGPDSSRDLNAEIFTDRGSSGSSGVWNTNASTGGAGAPNGIQNQIIASRTGVAPSLDGQWHADPEAATYGGTKEQQAAFFDAFFEPNSRSTALGYAVTNLQGSVQSPYSPTRFVVLYTTWQANDPLVHYVASDLNYTLPEGGLNPGTGTNTFNPPTVPPLLTSVNLGTLNDHYAPWGGNTINPPNPNTPDEQGTINQYNLAVKDPLIKLSDNWDFPTNKLPTVGWLGRVHRGTPWQTVDMKSSLPGIGNWATNWTGDLNAFDANNASPGEDRQLFDLFSTAFNDNATRGQLSVNVGATNGPSLAAWSAVFSGIVVPTNTTGGYTIIQPAGTYNAALPLASQPPLVQLVSDINATRLGYTNIYGLPVFEHVGDVLAAPFLTVSNQWLPLNDSANINDKMYEWLPQQTMSLLRDSGTPQSPMRYVIYCYGQTLKPAPNGIVTSGAAFGLCTNYQIVAESASRAVVQFDSTRTNLIDFTVSPPTVTATNINNNAVIENYNVLPPD